jgi:hypothetical protein
MRHGLLLHRRLFNQIIKATLLVALLFFAIPQPLSAQQSPDPQTYASWVREALAAAQRGDQIGLEDASARLIATKSVVLSDGSSVTVDNSWLAKELSRQPANMPLMATRLGALADALAQPTSQAPADALERLPS